MPNPPTTRNSLLLRLCQPADEQAWQEFVEIYEPLVYRLARRRGFQHANQAESLAKQLADASDEKQKAELKEKLQDTLGRQFDTQQKARELEVARIEAKVKKLRDTITKRHDARRTIIDKRLDQLLSEAEGLGWNSPSAGGGHAAVYVPQANGNYFAPAGGRFPGAGAEPKELVPIPVGR
jgi:hypothetical protein